MLFTTVVPAGRSKGCRTLGVSMGVEDSGTAVSPPPEEQHVEPGQSQLKHTRRAAQGIQTMPKTVLPFTPSIQLIKNRMGTEGTWDTLTYQS